MTSEPTPDAGPGATSPPTAPGGLRLRYAAVSDVGRVRKDNQDSGYAGPHLLAVADGVGGAARGDIASSSAIAALADLDQAPGNDLPALLASGIEAAQRRIAEVVAGHPELEGTSTTVTAAVFDGTRIGVGHVGDSRGYLLRDGEIYQLTKDHTFVQSLIDEGRITEEESRVHPHRHMILRAVDGVHEAEPDLFVVDVAAGDRLMLCSDGASGVLENPALGRLLDNGPLDQVAGVLVHEALEQGSNDNVTVVVADVVVADEPAIEDPDETQGMMLGPVVVGAASAPARPVATSDDTGEVGAPSDAAPAGGSAAESVARSPGSGPPPRETRDPEEIRYAPRAPRRFRWAARIAVLVVVVALIWVGGVAAYSWSQKQYYVASSDDTVAIYRGLEADVPLVRLHKVYERSDTAVQDLPDYYRGQVRDGMSASSLASARALVRRLGDAAVCNSASTSPTTSPTTTPTTSPTTTPSATPSAGATRRSTTSPTPTPTPSAQPTRAPDGSVVDCSDEP